MPKLVSNSLFSLLSSLLSSNCLPSPRLLMKCMEGSEEDSDDSDDAVASQVNFEWRTLVHGWCRVANLTKNLEQVSGDASSCRYKCWILISWNSFGLTKCSFCYEESWSPWLVRISTHLRFELRALQNSITGLVTLIGQEQLQLPCKSESS
ncbi:hypothetical protein Bca4012_077133 [Brassica carinata]